MRNSNRKKKAETIEALSQDLNGFTKKDGAPYVSTECADIEALGYTYENPFAGPINPSPFEDPKSLRLIVVQNINKAVIKGSFVVQVIRETKQKKQIIWEEAVFNRMDIETCKNCQENKIFGFSFPYRLNQYQDQDKKEDESQLTNEELLKRFKVIIQAQTKEVEQTLIESKAELSVEAQQSENSINEKCANDAVIFIGDSKSFLDESKRLDQLLSETEIQTDLI